VNLTGGILAARSTVYGTLCRESGHLVKLRKGANIASPICSSIPYVHAAAFLALPSGSIRAVLVESGMRTSQLLAGARSKPFAVRENRRRSGQILPRNAKRALPVSLFPQARRKPYTHTQELLCPKRKSVLWSCRRRVVLKQKNTSRAEAAEALDRASCKAPESQHGHAQPLLSGDEITHLQGQAAFLWRGDLRQSVCELPSHAAILG
jgi:hypothetical protein